MIRVRVPRVRSSTIIGSLGRDLSALTLSSSGNITAGSITADLNRTLDNATLQGIGELPISGELTQTLASLTLNSSAQILGTIDANLSAGLASVVLSSVAQNGEIQASIFQQIWIIDSRKLVSKRKKKRAKKAVQKITNSINAINRDIVDNAVSMALLTKQSAEIAKRLEELENEEAFLEAKQKAENYAEKVIKKALDTLKETAQKEAVKEARRQTTLRALRDALKYAEEQDDLEDLKLVMSLL